LTFDGGLDHPVLVVGLQEHPWAWDQLAASVARALNATLKSSGGDDATLTLREGEGEWSLPLGRAHGQLLLGLYAADLKRRTSGFFSAVPGAHLKPLAEPGVSGLFFDPGALKPSAQRIDPSLLLPVFEALLSGRFSELVDLPHPEGQAVELAAALTQLSEVKRDPLLQWLSEGATRSQALALPLILSLHELARLTLLVTEGLTLTVRTYRGTLSRLRAELRWRLL
jgi:hypothetical protein